MFRSLAVKLTLAFLLVGLTGSILVTVIFQQRTRAAFNNFIITQQQQTLADNLVVYYQTYGSWTGVSSDIINMQTYIPRQPEGIHNPPPDGNPITLVGTDRIIVYSNQPDEIGQKISKSELNGAISLQSNNQNIGWLMLSPVNRKFTPNTPEGDF